VEIVDRKAESIYNKLMDNVDLLKKENETLFSRLRKSKLQVLKLLIKIVEEVDPYTKGHSLQVYKYTIKMAKKRKLSRKLMGIIGRAALLHDIGKIAIDKKILNKRGKLTEEEYSEIKTHPIIGAEIVQEIEELHPTCIHILYHHAQYCGGGYPENAFKYEDIPIGARIIAIVDSYDAMISDRPYRKAYSREYAISELRRCAGGMYDPRLVEEFIAMLEEEHQKDDHIPQRDTARPDGSMYNSC
jgi:putative nucleotidyltransferase with HDIG domain